MEMMSNEINEQIDRNMEWINSLSYKTVQNMASERKLPANLKKLEIARLIALRNAGAEDELHQLLNNLKESRNRTNSRTRRVSLGQHSAPTPVLGYVTTTAEADSASANPDHDHDDDFYKNNDEVVRGPSQEAEPSTVPIPSDVGLLRQTELKSSYDMANTSGDSHAGMNQVLPDVLSSAVKSVPPQGINLSLANRLALDETTKPKKPTYKRPSSGCTSATSTKKVSKLGRVIKPRQDRNFFYPKMPHNSSSTYQASSLSSAPSFCSSTAVERTPFDHSNISSTVGPFSRSASLPAAILPSATVPSSSGVKPWPSSGIPSLLPAPAQHATINQFVSCDISRQIANQTNELAAPQPTESLYPYSHAGYPGLATYPTTLEASYSAGSSATHVLKPVPLPAVPSRNFPLNGCVDGYLEQLVNFKSGHLKMPIQLSPYWKPANTNCVNSYVSPICFASRRPYQVAKSRLRRNWTTPFSPNSNYEDRPFQPLPRSSCVQKPSSWCVNPFAQNYPIQPTNFQTDQQHKPFATNLQMPVEDHVPWDLQQHGLTSTYRGSFKYVQRPQQYHGFSTSSTVDQSNRRQIAAMPQSVPNNFQEQPFPKYQHEPHEVMGRPQKNVNLLMQPRPPTQRQHLPQHQPSPSTFQQGTSYGYSNRSDIAQEALYYSQKHPLPLVNQELACNAKAASIPHNLLHHQETNFMSTAALPVDLVHQETTTESHINQQQPFIQQPPLPQPEQLEPASKKFCHFQNQIIQQEQSNLVRSSHISPHLSQLPQRSRASGSEQSEMPSLPFPEFRGQNNQLSIPLIYDYLTSAEKQFSGMQNTPEPSTDRPDMYSHSFINHSNQTYDHNGNITSTFIEDVLPTLSQYAMDQDTKTRSATVSLGNAATSIASDNLSASTDCSPLNHYSDGSVCQSEKNDNAGEPMEGNSFKHVEESHERNLQKQSVGYLEENSETHLQACNIGYLEANSMTNYVQNSEGQTYTELSPMEVESQHIGNNDRSEYVQLLCLPSAKTHLIEESENQTLRVAKAVTESMLSPLTASNSLTVPLQNEIDTALVEKVVEEDEKTKQVIFLCSDGTGELEYMTLSVSQEDPFGTSPENVPATLPSSPQTSNIGQQEDSNIEETDLADKEESELSVSYSSHLSQISTLPLSGTLSTDTGTSISDYLSQKSSLELNTDNENDSGSPAWQKDSVTDQGITMQATLDCVLLDDPHRSTAVSQDVFAEVRASKEELDTSHDCSSPAVHLNVQGEISEGSCLTNEIRGPLEGPRASSFISSDSTSSSEDQVVLETTVKDEPIDLSKDEEGDESSGPNCESPSDDRTSVGSPLSLECSSVLDQDSSDGEKSPLYSDGIEEERVDHVSPVLHTKSGDKKYPGKRECHPVRSSPRFGGKASSSFSQQKSTSVPVRLPRIESAMQQIAKARKPCPNEIHGCPLILPPAQLASHYLLCEYALIECPAIGCGWECVAKKLSTHVREAHRGLIGIGSDSTHTVFVDQIHQQQNLTFLREVSRKLFVVCIHAYGNSIYASMQYIPPVRADKRITATGTLEVLDTSKQSHAWRGKIAPIQQQLDFVRNSGNCLQLSSEYLTDIPNGAITLFTNIRVNPSPCYQSPSDTFP